jgi:hypothetical protein
MNFSKVFWGLLIIFVGVCLLMVNFDLMSPESFEQIWRLWPIILIALGLSIMARGSSKVVSGFLATLSFVILIGFFVAFLHPATRPLFTKEIAETQKTIIAEPLNEDATSAKIEISTGAANLDVSGGSSQLVDGEVDSNFISVETSRSLSNKIDNFKINSKGISFPFFHGKNDWQLSFSDQIPLELSVNAGAVDADIDLTQTQTTKFIFKAGATTANIKFGSKTDLTKADINVGASTVILNIPQEVGIKVTAKIGATSNNFTAFGLERSGDVYQSKSYDAFAKKIEITLQTGASSIELKKI